MPALDIPEALHAKLRRIAATHKRSVAQETIYLIETAIATEETDAFQKSKPSAPETGSYWANRKLLPDYEAALKAGALASNDDCAIGLSEERDAR